MYAQRKAGNPAAGFSEPGISERASCRELAEPIQLDLVLIFYLCAAPNRACCTDGFSCCAVVVVAAVAAAAAADDVVVVVVIIIFVCLTPFFLKFYLTTLVFFIFHPFLQVIYNCAPSFSLESTAP